MPRDPAPDPGPAARPDPETAAEQVFAALADPTRRAILAELAARGPATGTDLAARLPITRQAIAKHLTHLSHAGLLTAQPGERRRIRYRLHPAPMRIAQQYLAALARDWDTTLDALKDHLDRPAHAPTTLPKTSPLQEAKEQSQGELGDRDNDHSQNRNT